MSSKDKDQHPLNKLKHFFRSGTKISGSGIKERDIWPALELELRLDNSLVNRCKTLVELGDFVLNTKIEDTSVNKLWNLSKDIICDTNSTEHRQIALTFYRKLIQGQYNNLTIMREHFFIVVKNHNVNEDLKHRLEILIALTENGKDISNFEERIGRFMMDLVPAIVKANHTGIYLDMLANIIKFNAAHLDNEIVVEIVQTVCNLCCSVDNTDIGLQCLKILELVMCYTIFPNETLTLCVMTLCRTVNNVPYCQTSWKNMKNLLGTNLGYASLLIMCNILNDKNFYEDQDLLRGAVFHTNMGVFGSVAAIQQTPRFSTKSTVLTSFLHALESKKLIVTYEVILSMNMMIPKYGVELPEHIWDIICDIFFALADNIRYYESNGLRKDIILQKQFHETIDTIEAMLKNEEILANPEIIYDLIEKVSETRPEISVLNLIDYRSSKITPARSEWLSLLYNFIQRFYSISSSKIRIKTVQSLVTIMEANRDAYEEEILERVVIPVFSGISDESDLHVRTVVAKALIDFAMHCDTKRCGELLDILEKILYRPFDQHSIENIVYKSDSELIDVCTVVEGLINIFLVKLYRLPSCHAVRIFQMLVGFMETHYQKPKVLEQVNIIRRKIFSWMMKARANTVYRIGYPESRKNGKILYSHYLGIDSSLPIHAVNIQQPIALHNCHETIPTLTYTTISIRRACKIIVVALDSETDYFIFQLLVKELPIIMQNKALIQGNDIESLACALFRCLTLFDRTFTYNFIKPTSDEYNALILPAIASLITYHQFLPPQRQLSIMEALKSGIYSRIAINICINALTIMILEIPEIVMRKLHEVLLQMSKMSDTVNVAIPVLEFLSILSHLPNHMFAHFVPVQYMYIFAISLPYTKPHRYHHYTVSLAHHVIAKWFLKCKLGLRKNCVNYIISSIQANASLLLEDLELRNMPRSSVNEDSSNRKRSTSLTERGSRARDFSSNMRPLMNANLKSFHSELAETCIDFLAQHTYSPCSSLPKRLPAIDNILKDGPSQTWLVGHNLVTITTSGCATAPNSNGLCVRCSSMTNNNSQQLIKSESSSGKTLVGGMSSLEITYADHQKEALVDLPSNNRRYTKASLQYSSGTESSSTDLTSSTSSSSQAQTSDRNKAQRQTSNSSSGSLEALSRRGSNPDSIESRDRETNRSVNGSNGGSILGNSLYQLSTASSTSQSETQQQICARSCTGWAEVYIRRPTGNIAWVMRIQNPIINECLGTGMPFHDLISLFLPTQHGGVFGPDFVSEAKLLSSELTAEGANSNKNEEQKKSDRIEQQIIKAAAKVRLLKRQEEITSTSLSGPIDIPKPAKSHLPDQLENYSDNDDDDKTFDMDDSRSRNPVRRVNSSPEMSSSWRTTFLAGKQYAKESNNVEPFSHIVNADKERELYSDFSEQQLKKKCGGYAKDMRVSCEAIPEEIAGSTPPSLSESLKESHVSKLTPLSTEKSDSSLQVGKEPMLPPKQHSADDVINQTAIKPVTVSTSISNLRVSMDFKKKPLQSVAPPAPLSPRLLVASMSSANRGNNMPSSDYGTIDKIRGRSKTISVVSEVSSGRTTRPLPTFRTHSSTKSNNVSKLGINPSFVFLQLFHTGLFQVTEEPLKVPPEMSVSLDILNLIPPFETHKIGVLYVGPGQCNNEVEILKNRYGSTRYVEFVRNIGTLISLKDSKENNLFINMETTGRDGKFTYIWKDEITQVTFHVATLMPNNENDPNCTEKKKNIGNDYVCIVYNESGEEYNLNTIRGQFSSACVVVQPLELNTNRIFVRARPEISEFVCRPEPMIVSNRSAPVLARQLALHADLAAHVYQSLKTKSPYASNRLERLRRIKNLRARLINENGKLNSSDVQETSNSVGDVSKNRQNPTSSDFTKYT